MEIGYLGLELPVTSITFTYDAGVYGYPRSFRPVGLREQNEYLRRRWPVQAPFFRAFVQRRTLYWLVGHPPIAAGAGWGHSLN
jgi:hypothetical protein